MVCANCATHYMGNFCHTCGQKSAGLKYTLTGMISEIFHSVFHVEKKSLPHTIRELTLRPGDAIAKFIKGQRQFLYPPFKYLVLMGAIVIIFSLRYKFFHSDYTELDDKNSFLDGFLVHEHLTYLEDFFQFAEEKATILNIASIPVFALVSWAFLTHRKFSFAENIVINAFITAQQLFFLLLLVPIIEIFYSFKGAIILSYSVSIIVYNIFVYVQLVKGRMAMTTLKSAITVVVAFAYQVPVNLLIYFLYNAYHEHIQWVTDKM